MLEFQSTRPRGARPERVGFKQSYISVSIHAPARGATRVIGIASSSLLTFQSTRPRGARLRTDKEWRFIYPFQSTRPRGARPQA